MPVVTSSDATNELYDYIIVGGGTAGLIVGARLTEDPTVTVLVLEAGGNHIDDPLLNMPATYGATFGQEKYDWSFRTTPQKHSNDFEYVWPRGRTLGGSSATNFFAYCKPPADEIDDFERLGNPGWNWANFQKFVARSENFVLPPRGEALPHQERAYDWSMGKGGPITLAVPSRICSGERDVEQTFINTGIPWAEAPMNGDPKGLTYIATTVDPKTHKRTFTGPGYWVPNQHRPNFSLLVNATARRVILEGTEPEINASGVEFSLQGNQSTILVARARKEVILSAGSIKSPQLLELSGIGDKSLLNRLGIETKVDLPAVGGNVQEHCFLVTTMELREDVTHETFDRLRDPDQAAKELELYAKGEGLYTHGVANFAFVPLDWISPRAKEIHEAHRKRIAQNMDAYSPGLREQYKIQLERLEKQSPACELMNFPAFASKPNPPEPGKRYHSLQAGMNHFWSRGTVHIKSSDPLVQPEIDPHYFEQQIDLDTYVETIKFLRSLKDVSPWKDIVATEINPGPSVQTDEEIANWVKESMSTTFHTAGTCSMLPKDKDGVVDPELKVYGTRNLRVVDMSIVPLLFAAHTQSVLYGLAEQAAAIIKNEKIV